LSFVSYFFFPFLLFSIIHLYILWFIHSRFRFVPSSRCYLLCSSPLLLYLSFPFLIQLCRNLASCCNAIYSFLA
jgi:hypothetical protein